MVTICILNWNKRHIVEETVKRLSSLQLEHEVLIWDQNSQDGSVEYLKSIQHLPNYYIMFSDKNVGSSIARNRMVERAKYDYVLLLDSDIIPISDSIPKMVDFLKSHDGYVCIGYNQFNCSPTQETEKELGIKDEHVTNQTIAYTQYGLFRKSVLTSIPFPEFAPFDGPGWGAEDDMVGRTIVDNNVGKIGRIEGRIYLHKNRHSSWNDLGEDETARLYGKRYATYVYFTTYLNSFQKWMTLRFQKLITTRVDLKKYHWTWKSNLGDLATHEIFTELFPFIEFTDTSSNYFMFGGSILSHVRYLKSRTGVEPKHVLAYGVGISHDYDIDVMPGVTYDVYPRGPATKTELDKHTSNVFRVNDHVGDILQLYAFHPRVKPNGHEPLYIKDAYSEQHAYDGKNRISVARSELTKDVPYVSMQEYPSVLSRYSRVYSSQIHPFLIAVMLGMPSHLIEKDLRARDIREYFKLETDVPEFRALQCRQESQQRSLRVIEHVLSVLKPFAHPEFDQNSISAPSSVKQRKLLLYMGKDANTFSQGLGHRKEYDMIYWANSFGAIADVITDRDTLDIICFGTGLLESSVIQLAKFKNPRTRVIYVDENVQESEFSYKAHIVRYADKVYVAHPILKSFYEHVFATFGWTDKKLQQIQRVDEITFEDIVAKPIEQPTSICVLHTNARTEFFQPAFQMANELGYPILTHDLTALLPLQSILGYEPDNVYMLNGSLSNEKLVNDRRKFELSYIQFSMYANITQEHLLGLQRGFVDHSYSAHYLVCDMDSRIQYIPELNYRSLFYSAPTKDIDFAFIQEMLLLRNNKFVPNDYIKLANRGHRLVVTGFPRDFFKHPNIYSEPHVWGATYRDMLSRTKTVVGIPKILPSYTSSRETHAIMSGCGLSMMRGSEVERTYRNANYYTTFDDLVVNTNIEDASRFDIKENMFKYFKIHGS